MVDTPAHLAYRLTQEGDNTIAFFRAISPSGWDQLVYNEGANWKVQHILAHFVATEKGINILIIDILAGGSGAPDNFDINSFNEKEVVALKNLATADLLNQLSKLRLANIKIVSGMNPDDLAKMGRHPYFGRASLLDIIKLLYRHHQIHLRDIRRVLAI